MLNYLSKNQKMFAIILKKSNKLYQPSHFFASFDVSQNAILEIKYLRSRSVTLENGKEKYRKYLSYVFTKLRKKLSKVKKMKINMKLGVG